MGYLPGFGIVIIIACFQVSGKYCRRRQLLNIFVIRSSAFFGRFFSAVLDIVSSPGALRVESCLMMSSICPGEV